MKIFIMGASCAGSSTLGRQLAITLNMPYFDTDDYFWVQTEIPYSKKQDPAMRNQLLKNDVTEQLNCIVGGSLVSWGEEWKSIFDLVVFLYLPVDVRMIRLKDRELSRYGDAIFTDAVRNKIYNDFIDWAEQYDNRGFNGRNIKIHEDWLAGAHCPVLEIRGDKTVQEREDLVLLHLNKCGLCSS